MISNDFIEPSTITLLRIKKDSDKKGNGFFASFDEKGHFVQTMLLDDVAITPSKSFNEKRLKQLGFKMKDHEIDAYLKDKQLKIYQKCHCITNVHEIEQEDRCNPKECLEPKEIQKVNKRI